MMDDQIFSVLMALGGKSRCRKPEHVNGLWLVATGLYFLEFTKAKKRSGEFCFHQELWSLRTPFLTVVPCAGAVAVVYISTKIERITAATVIPVVKKYFCPQTSEIRFFKQPFDLDVIVHRPKKFLSLDVAQPTLTELESLYERQPTNSS